MTFSSSLSSYDLFGLNGYGVRLSIVPLTDLGLRLFPLYEDKKLPAITGWIEAASKDPGRVIEWWNEPRTKHANLGIATGEGSGIVVLDADDEEALDWCTDLFFGHPPHVRTKRGGHFYVQYPKGIDVRNSASKLFKGVDVRGNGGLVVAPPSVVNGFRYQWESAWQFPIPCSETLRDWLSPQKPKREHAPQSHVVQASYSGVPGKIATIVKNQIALVASAPEGMRNESLYQAAFLLGSIQKSRVCSVRHFLHDLVSASSLPTKERDATAHNAWKAGETNGRFTWTQEDARDELLASIRDGI
jgi:hypothetical protein